MRYEVLRTFFHVILAPCGKFQFRHYFMADILTSIVKPITDIRYSFCYFITTTSWLRDTDEECSASDNTVGYVLNIVLTILPYWFRIA